VLAVILSARQADSNEPKAPTEQSDRLAPALVGPPHRRIPFSRFRAVGSANAGAGSGERPNWPDAALYPLASAALRADRHTVGQQTQTSSRRLLAAGADSFS